MVTLTSAPTGNKLTNGINMLEGVYHYPEVFAKIPDTLGVYLEGYVKHNLAAQLFWTGDEAEEELSLVKESDIFVLPKSFC